MLIRVLEAVIVGSGIALPTSTAIINKFYLANGNQPIPKELRNSDSILEINWMGKGIHKEIGDAIEGFGKILNESSYNKPDIVNGIELHTSGQFNQDVCEKLGLTSTKGKDIGIGCSLSTKQ